VRPYAGRIYNFFVCDATACPPDLEHRNADESGAVRAEKLLILPHYYVCSAPRAPFAAEKQLTTGTPTSTVDLLRRDHGVPHTTNGRRPFVLACFNQVHKVQAASPECALDSNLRPHISAVSLPTARQNHRITFCPVAGYHAPDTACNIVVDHGRRRQRPRNPAARRGGSTRYLRQTFDFR